MWSPSGRKHRILCEGRDLDQPVYYVPECISDGKGGTAVSCIHFEVEEATSSITGRAFHDQLADGLISEGDEALRSRSWALYE